MPEQTKKLSLPTRDRIKSGQPCNASASRVARLRLGASLLLYFAAASLSAAESRTADVLGNALEGEFALQGGQLDQAAAAYAQAAAQSGQLDLIERASTVTLYAKDYDAARRVGQRWVEQAPDSIGGRRTLAWAALASDDVEAGDRWLAELAAIDSVEAQRAIAQVLVAAENRDLAPASLRHLAAAGALRPLEEGPSWSAVAANLGDYGTAKQLAAAETQAYPKSAEAWRRSAQVMLATGDSKGAEKSLERAVNLAPDDFDLRLALASVYAEAERQDLADRVLSQAKPQDERALAARLANVASKPERKLLKRIERALKKSKAGELESRAFLLGQLYELKEDPDQALHWYAQEPAGSGAWHEAQLRRGVLLARDKQDLPGARKLLAELRVQTEDSDQRTDAYLLEAELLAEDDRAAAGAVYDEAIAQNGRDVRLLYARALFRIGDDDVAGLEADLRQILALDPENPQALNALGYTLADRTDRHLEALGYIQRAIAAQPNDGAFVDSMGWVQYRLGNLSEALMYLKRAYQLVQDGDVAAHLAEVLWMSDQREEARALWREALQQWPDSAVLIESVRKLQPDLLP
jgi:Flp pilus assembly protein TadD